MNKQIRRFFERIYRRFNLLVSGGRIARTNGPLAQVSFSPGEVRDSIPIVHQYGFYSVPPEGSPCLVISSGVRESSSVIASGDSKFSTPKTPGVVKIYHESGAKVRLEKDKISMEASNFFIKGHKVVVGNGDSDLISLLKDLVKVLQAATAIDGVKILPLDPKTVAELAKLATKLGAYK